MNSLIKRVLLAFMTVQIVSLQAMSTSSWLSKNAISRYYNQISLRNKVLAAGTALAGAAGLAYWMLNRKNAQVPQVPQNNNQAQAVVAGVSAQVSEQVSASEAQNQPLLAASMNAALSDNIVRPESQAEVSVPAYAVDGLQEEFKEEEFKNAGADAVQVSYVLDPGAIQDICDKVKQAIEANDWTLILHNHTTWKNALEKLPELLEVPLGHAQRALRDLNQMLERAPWNGGASLITEIHNNSAQPATRESVSTLVWHLFKKACDKNQYFTEGTYILEDPDHKLLKWMKTCPEVYERRSSHLYEYRYGQVRRNQGLDIPGGILPNHKNHILFDGFLHEGPTKMPFLFLKPETAGINIGVEGAIHGAELVRARVKKLIPGADDVPNCRRERVPWAVASIFESVVNSAQQISVSGGWARWATSFVPVGGCDYRHELVLEGNQWGIWKMRAIVDQLVRDNQHNNELANLAHDFYSEISQYDNLEIRKGREIILLLKDLVP